MTPRNLLGSVVTAALLALAAPATAQDIAFNSDNSYPESFTYSAEQDVFFVSSVTQGLVAKVDKAGAYAPFISDDRLVWTVGHLVDDATDTLWATNSDPGAGARTDAATQGTLAAIATYDATGEPKLTTIWVRSATAQISLMTSSWMRPAMRTSPTASLR